MSRMHEPTIVGTGSAVVAKVGTMHQQKHNFTCQNLGSKHVNNHLVNSMFNHNFESQMKIQNDTTTSGRGFVGAVKNSWSRHLQIHGIGRKPLHPGWLINPSWLVSLDICGLKPTCLMGISTSWTKATI